MLALLLLSSVTFFFEGVNALLFLIHKSVREEESLRVEDPVQECVRIISELQEEKIQTQSDIKNQ